MILTNNAFFGSCNQLLCYVSLHSEEKRNKNNNDDSNNNGGDDSNTGKETKQSIINSKVTQWLQTHGMRK